MTNYEKYCDVFRKVFELGDDVDVTKLAFQEAPMWDSIGHMNLVAVLEETFDIRFEIDDIIDLSSFSKGIEILNKLNVQIQ